MAELHIPGLENYPGAKKAFSELERLVDKEEPERTAKLIEFLDKHPNAANLVRAETQDRYEEIYQAAQKLINPPGFTHEGLKWEPKKHDEWMTYDQSEARLKQEGYKRHPHPQEEFSLIIRHLEGTLEDKLVPVAKDMLQGKGEWLDPAFQRQGKTLLLYKNPNIKWNGKEYVPTGTKISQTPPKEFDITGLQPGNWNKGRKVDEQNPELFKYIYTRRFSELPEEMKERNLETGIYITNSQKLWPAARSGGNNRFGIDFRDFYSGASRGVRAEGAAPEKTPQ